MPAPHWVHIISYDSYRTYVSTTWADGRWSPALMASCMIATWAHKCHQTSLAEDRQRCAQHGSQEHRCRLLASIAIRSVRLEPLSNLPRLTRAAHMTWTACNMHVLHGFRPAGRGALVWGLRIQCGAHACEAHGVACMDARVRNGTTGRLFVSGVYSTHIIVSPRSTPHRTRTRGRCP